MGFLSYFGIAGEILAEAWTLYRKCFWRLLPVYLFFSMPKIAEMLIFNDTDESSWLANAFQVLFLIPIWIGTVLCIGACGRLLEMVRKDDHGPWIKHCVLFGWGRFFKLLGAYMLLVLSLLVPTFIALFLIFLAIFLVKLIALPGATTVAASIIIGVPAACLAIWLLVKLSLAPYVSLFEGWNPIRAVIRSFVLTSGNFWILLISYAALLLPLFAIAYLIGYIGMPATNIMVTFLGILFGSFLIAVAYHAYIRLSGEE